MGVVTVSSSAPRASLGLSRGLTLPQTNVKGPYVLGFKSDKQKKITLVGPSEPVCLHIEKKKDNQKKGRSVRKPSKGRVGVATIAEASPCTTDLDLNEAAAKLESIFKLSPATDILNEENLDGVVKKTQRFTKVDEKSERQSVVRNRKRKTKRLSLDRRIEMKKDKDMELKMKKEINTDNEDIAVPKTKKGIKMSTEDIMVPKMKKEIVTDRKEMVAPRMRKMKVSINEDGRIDELVREYSASSDMVSLDWKKMKIPPVLPSSEHTWLFKLLETRKALLQVKENLHRELGRDLTDAELGKATNMSVFQVRRHLDVGHAARNKLIKHNLRLVLFVMNKYFQDFTNGPKFQDLCQAGVKGLIIAVDRFEPRRKFQLSTYALFWIRHAIIRSMTVSNFTRVPFGLESVRVEIQKAKLELMFELKRMPTEEEVIDKVGISPERYQDVKRAANSVASLHSKNKVTQEELINGITDVDGVGSDKWRQPALLRLAIDDVLDSLKPKESLVIRQRYGLDGKGDRTLGEIAGNLNISREMVRKHEMKALMKLKHPARMDYLRHHIH